MALNQFTQQKLTAAIAKLPPYKVQEVIDFVEFLLYREELPEDPQGQDPLQAYIGGVAHGTLATNIDEELYPS
jgi:hypothetical protein